MVVGQQVDCGWCGEVFVKKYYNQLYCNRGCQNRAKMQRRFESGKKMGYTLRRRYVRRGR